MKGRHDKISRVRQMDKQFGSIVGDIQKGRKRLWRMRGTEDVILNK
jgi:hypothetical protein